MCQMLQLNSFLMISYNQVADTFNFLRFNFKYEFYVNCKEKS